MSKDNTERRNRKKLRIQDEEVHHTRRGTFIRGKVALRELIEQVNLANRPSQPWDDTETYRRWSDSLAAGHRQLFFKCQHCSLEFVLLTLRTEVEALEAYEPSHGEHGGVCAKVTCPECGKPGMSVLLGSRTQDGPIFEFVASCARQHGTGDHIDEN